MLCQCSFWAIIKLIIFIDCLYRHFLSSTCGSLSVHSCLCRGGIADWAGGQCSPSVLPFTEYSGVRPSVMSNVRNTRNSSASYSKNSSVASRQSRKSLFIFFFFYLDHYTKRNTILHYPTTEGDTIFPVWPLDRY